MRVEIAAGISGKEQLSQLIAAPIDVLVLVDHRHLPSPVLQDGATWFDLVRAEGQFAVAAIELARRAERVLVLQTADPWTETLCRFLGLPHVEMEQARPELVPATGRACSGPAEVDYLVPLFAALPSGNRVTLAWSRECFFDGDAPGSVLPETVEVAGRARILAYGPYWPLPTGGWRATAYLGFSADFDRMPLILEVDTGHAVSRGFFEVESPGIFTIDLDFTVRELLHPVEIRLISQDSAIEGRVALIEVILDERRPAEEGLSVP